MKDEFGNEKTAKQIAKGMVSSAVNGRLWSLLDEVDENLKLTDKQGAEVKRHLETYLKRLDKLIG